MSTKSILLKRILSAWSLDVHIMSAAAVESPDTKNKGPKMELFHKGRALKADNRIPV